jgi:hypothetical protein
MASSRFTRPSARTSSTTRACSCSLISSTRSPDPQAQAQLGVVERPGEVVVRARLEPMHHVFLPVAAGEQHEIDWPPLHAAPHPPADLDAIHPGHHPVEESQRRAIVLLEHLARALAVVDRRDVAAPLGEERRQVEPGGQIIFGD